MTESRIDRTTVLKAKTLADQGHISEAWAVLGKAGDRYAATAATITKPNILGHGLLGVIVRNFWDAQIGEKTRIAKWDAVAAKHLKNYLYELRFHQGKLPETTFIEKSYNQALKKNGLPKSLSIDNVLNIATTRRKGTVKLLDGLVDGGIYDLDYDFDPPDWHQWLGLRPERSVRNSGNKAENVSIPGLVGRNAAEYGKDIVEPLADAAMDVYGFVAKQFQRPSKAPRRPLENDSGVKPDTGSQFYGAPGSMPRRVVLGAADSNSAQGAQIRNPHRLELDVASRTPKSIKISPMSFADQAVASEIKLSNSSPFMSEHHLMPEPPQGELYGEPQWDHMHRGSQFLRGRAHQPRRTFMAGQRRRAGKAVPIIARFS